MNVIQEKAKELGLNTELIEKLNEDYYKGLLCSLSIVENMIANNKTNEKALDLSKEVLLLIALQKEIGSQLNVRELKIRQLVIDVESLVLSAELDYQTELDVKYLAVLFCNFSVLATDGSGNKTTINESLKLLLANNEEGSDLNDFAQIYRDTYLAHLFSYAMGGTL